jgi:hypothetical protein
MTQENPAGRKDPFTHYSAGVVVGRTSDNQLVYGHTGGLPGQGTRSGYVPMAKAGKAYAGVQSFRSDRHQIDKEGQAHLHALQKMCPLLDRDIAATLTQLFYASMHRDIEVPAPEKPPRAKYTR